VDEGGIDMYLIRNYGTLTYQSVLAHVQSYAFQDGRPSKNFTNLFNYIEGTHTEEAMNTMYAERHLYTITRGSVLAATIQGLKIQLVTMMTNFVMESCYCGQLLISLQLKPTQPSAQ
jgi:hypothetical protein